MNPTRLLVGLAIVCGVVVFAAVPLAAGAEGALEHAEQQLEKAAHSDPDPPGASDPLAVDPDLAIWTVVVFVILLLVLKQFAFGPILEAIQRREGHIADQIAQAEKRHEQARELLAEYEQKLAGAAKEVRELLDEARRDAEHTKQEILAEAKAGADAERARALRDIESAADAAVKSLAERSTELAVELAGKIVQAKLTKDDHARLIEEAMAKFPASTPSNN
jgi:F-type H+-transporting ATPase subunit b